MATAQKEIPIDDDELDGLMAQLEAETAGVVDAPSASAAPAAGDDEVDLSGLEDDLTPSAAAGGAPDADELAEIVAAADEAEQLAATAAAAAHQTKSMAQAAAGKITKFDPPEEILVADDAPFEVDDLSKLKPSGTIELSSKDAAMLAELVENPPPPNDALKKAAARAAPAPDPDAELESLAAELEAGAVTEAKMAPPTANAKQTRMDAELAALAAKVKASPAPAPKADAIKSTIPDDDVAHPNPTPAPAASKPPKSSHLIDPAEFKRETKVSMTNLDECMIEQSSLRAYYGTLAADAEAEHAKLKLRHDIIEARVYDKHRKALADAGEKVTEKMVENAVKQDPEWAQSKLRVIEAEQVANRNRACVDSLKDRKDMLVQLGADRREEGKGQVRILEAAASHEDKRAAAMAALAKSRGM
jgi:hypothetical protein